MNEEEIKEILYNIIDLGRRDYHDEVLIGNIHLRAIMHLMELYNREKAKTHQRVSMGGCTYLSIFEVNDNYISKSKIKEKITEKINYYISYRGLEIYKKDNYKEIVITLEQLKQELLEE